MPIRTCTKAHTYDGHQYEVGDRIDVEQRYIPMQLALGRIAPEAGDPGYEKRDITADAPAAYLTRDMAPARAQPQRLGRKGH